MLTEPKKPVLLPADALPEKYTITLEPDLKTFQFEAKQDILVNVVNPCNEITLHSRELYIKSAIFVSVDENGEEGTGIKAEQMNFNVKYYTCQFVFPETLNVGKGKIQLEFTGFLNADMAGFYRSKYTAVDGTSKYMASTQFEALDARRCFPCWDEPDRKAIFDVTMVVDAALTVFSNMPEISTQMLDDGRKRVHFADSPKMSTYLLAFCLGEFDFVQGFTKSGVQVRVYTPPGKANNGEFSLDVGIKSLDLYDDYFQIPYPLPKLDMVAIPEFAMGAMENWGLVTYREVDLLIDKAEASSQQKQRVCTVVTHELAHQWFGNLVTMKWWDDLWLNEGFASWMQTYAADTLFPDWKMWEQFVNDDQASALRLDSLRSSHPIQVPIGHAEEVEEVFDMISYSKGGSVIRQLHAVLGASDFQKGLQNYMKKHQYSNTVTSDLWGAWEEVSGKPIQSTMASWTEQMGYPVVTVKSHNYAAGKLTLTLNQQWFLADGSKIEPAEAKIWAVPVIVGTADQPAENQSTQHLMEEAEMTIEVPLSAETQWVKLNYGQHGLYRIAYPPNMLGHLAAAVTSKSVSPADRAGLLNDTYALAKAGHMDMPVMAKLLAAYSNEDDYSAWDAMHMVIDQLDKVLINDPQTYPAFCGFIAKIVTEPYKKIGWDNSPSDGHLDRMLRGTLVSLACKYDVDGAHAEASKRFAVFYDGDATALPTDFRASAFRTVLKHGGVAEYEKCLELFDRAEDNAQKKLVMHALGSAGSVELKRRTMEWTENLKLQDFFYPMRGVAASGLEGQEVAFSYFEEKFCEIKQKLASASPSLLDAVIIFCCGMACSDAALARLTAFFDKNPLPQNQRKIKQMKENMSNDIKFLKSLKATELGDAAFWEGL